MERFATPLPCIYSDGEQEHDKGPLGIYAAITFKRFQQLMTQKTGVPASQLSAVLAYKRNVNGEEKRQKLNINESTNFGIVLRIHSKEIDAHFVIALKRSKKDRKGAARRKAPGLEDEDETSSTRSESPVRKELTSFSKQGHDATADSQVKATPNEPSSPVSTLPDNPGRLPPSPISPDEEAPRSQHFQTFSTAESEDKARQEKLSTNHFAESDVARKLEPTLRPTSSELEEDCQPSSAQRAQAKFDGPYEFQTENIHDRTVSKPQAKGDGSIYDFQTETIYNRTENLQTAASVHPSGFRGSAEHVPKKQVEVAPVAEDQSTSSSFFSTTPKQDENPGSHQDSCPEASTLAYLRDKQFQAYAQEPFRSHDYAATGAPEFSNDPRQLPSRRPQLVSASLVASAVSEALTPQRAAELTRGHPGLARYERGSFEMHGLYGVLRDPAAGRNGFRANFQRACRFCVFCWERQGVQPPFHWCVDDPVVPGFHGPSPAGPIERPGKRIKAAA